MSKRVTFTDRGDGEGPWEVAVDEVVIIAELRQGEMDVSARALEPLWAAIGIELTFEWRGK